MGPVAYRCRRRSWWTTVVLVGLLGAIIGGVCATAVAGARRTSSAADRLQQAAGEPDALIDATEVDPATWARIAQLPSVVRSGRFAYTFVAPAQDPDGYYPVFTRTDGLDDSLSQGHLVAGRRVRPGAADEVVLAEPIADRLDVGVGDLLHLASWSPEGALQVAVGDPIEPDGPAIDLRVVGLTRSTQDVLSRPDDVILTFLGPGVHDRYREEIGVADGLFLADLRGGDGALDVLAEEMRQVYPDGPVPRIDPAGVTVLSLEDSLNVLAGGLYIFAAVAGLFGLGAIAQVATRSVARGDAEQRILAGLGLTRRGRLLDAWLPIGAAAVVGGVGAVVVAVVASSAMPIGLAHRVDPALGTSFDGLVLPVAGLSVVVVIGGIGAGAAWRLAARPLAVPSIDRSGDPQRPVAVLARRGPPAVAVGLSMAAVSGRRPEAGAVRASMLGIAVAVAGLAAVAVFGSSMARLLDTPERYGWSWDVAVRLRGEATAEDIAASSDVEAVALGVFNQTVQIDGRPYNAMALAPLTGDASPAPVEGRAPLAPDEVALGADTRWELGDPEVVTALGSEGDGQEFRVVGTAIMPTIDDPIPIAEGAVFSLAGLDQLGLAAPVEDSSGFRATVIDFQEGIDPERALTRLGLEGARPVFPTAPAEISRLDQVSGLPRVLAGLLAGLAVIAVGNALWQTVRRRRRDLAVLRAMGFDRGQVVAAMSWQAFALAVIGLVIGLPVGVVVGRWMWSLLAGALGVATDPITPPTTLVLVPVTVALAVVAGAAFGAVATRRSPSHALRAD